MFFFIESLNKLEKYSQFSSISKVKKNVNSVRHMNDHQWNYLILLVIFVMFISELREHILLKKTQVMKRRAKDIFKKFQTISYLNQNYVYNNFSVKDPVI